MSVLHHWVVFGQDKSVKTVPIRDNPGAGDRETRQQKIGGTALWPWCGRCRRIFRLEMPGRLPANEDVTLL